MAADKKEAEIEMKKAVTLIKDIHTKARLVALVHHQKEKERLDDEEEAEMAIIKKKYEQLNMPLLQQ